MKNQEEKKMAAMMTATSKNSKRLESNDDGHRAREPMHSACNDPDADLASGGVCEPTIASPDKVAMPSRIVSD